MRMKKLLILSLIILSSCSNKNDFNLTASSDIDSDEMVYLVQYKENIPVLKDSSNVVEGKFTFSDSIVVPEMYYLFFKNIKGNIPVVLEPGDINLTVFKDSLRSTKITGTKSNDDFKKYIDESSPLINELNNIQNEINYNIALNDSLLVDDLEEQFVNMRKKLTDYEFEFMTNKNDSYISALILQRMVFERSIDYDKADSIMKTFDESLKLTSPFTAVEKIIENFRLSNTEAPRIGSFAPKFSGPGLDGEIISLYGIKSKYILIDFWASWCAPCREEIPELNEFYKNKDINLIAIAIDEIADVVKFQDEIPIQYPSFIANELEGVTLAKKLGNERGVLPFTVIIQPDGSVKKSFYGKVKISDLNQALSDNSCLLYTSDAADE